MDFYHKINSKKISIKDVIYIITNIFINEIKMDLIIIFLILNNFLGS